MITHLKFVSIPTRDQAAALDFWTERVGFSLESDQHFSERQRWIELSVPGADTRIVLFTPEGFEERIGTMFNGAFACDDVEATFKELSARGVEFSSPPKSQPWGTFATFRDPDGNQFVLSSK